MELNVDEKNNCIHRWVYKWVVEVREAKPIYDPASRTEKVFMRLKRVKRRVCVHCGMMKYRATGNMFRKVKKEKVVMDRVPRKSDNPQKEGKTKRQPGVFDSA